MGSHIPPRKALQDRWAEFLVNSSRAPLSGALGAFDANRVNSNPLLDALPTGLPASWPSAFEANPLANCQPFEVKEQRSRVFRAAHVLASRYTLKLTGGALEVTAAGTTGQPFVLTVPVPSHPPTVDSYLDLETYSQNEDPELFMLWVAKQGMLDPTQMAWTLLVCDIFLLTLAWPVFEAKALAMVPRPYDPPWNLGPILDKPGHSSWPGGHAFVGGVMTALISHWANAQRVPLDALKRAAARIAFNRERAGLHWTHDSEAGYAMGAALGLELINFLKRADHVVDPRSHRLFQMLQCAKAEWTT